MEDLVLRTEELTKTFARKNAVARVNMHVAKGDIYGFIGKNGAGKTTLMRMVTGLARPTSGEIELFGSKGLNKQRIRIGSIIENPGVYANMTAQENIEIFRNIYGISQKHIVEERLHSVGLDHLGKKKVKHFSLGMKQRLGIAIALLGNPDFLILDEPMNGLDPEGIKEIRDLLLQLNQDQKITILISSHILGELSKIATKYGIIRDGVLMEEFSKEELETRCRRCLKLRVEPVQKAASILETILKIRNYDVLSDNTIRIFERLDEVGHINTTLVKNDVTLYSCQEIGQDLEGYFIDLMGGSYDA